MSETMYHFHFDRKLMPDELRAVLSRVFAISEQNVVFCDDVEGLPASSEEILGCVIWTDHGEFCQHVECYPHRASLARDFSEVELAKSLTVALNCRCLVSDYSYNPFRWLLVDTNGTVSFVSVDARALDNNELRITG